VSRRLGIPVYLLLSLAGFTLFSLDEAEAQSSFGGAPAPSAVNPAYVQLPVTFEMNRGQAASDVKAIARTAAGVATFKRNEMFLPVPGSRSPLRFSLSAQTEVSVAPESATGGVVNYINGPERSQWFQGLPLYRGIRYKSAAEGVDLVLHGTQGRLEYDFNLAPRADVLSAQLRIEDPAGLSLQPDGSLLVTPAEGGTLRLDAPTAFQFRNGSRTSVEVSFQVDDRTIGFRLGSYDPELPLVIDPVVSYTTLIGVNNSISVNGFGVDSLGDVIFTGSTFANNLPVVNGSKNNSSGSEQVYVTKLDSSGGNVLFSTYFPAAGFNTASSLALDSAGNVYVSGITGDPAFPVTSQNIGSCSQFCNTGFVVKLDPSGKVVYSTLIGSGQQLPKGLAVNSAGEVYVAGLTADAGLKTVNAYDPNYGGGLCTSCSSGFFGKLNANGSDWVFSSYFPILPYYSFNQQYGVFISALAVDPSGNFYIGGTGAAFTLLRPLVISATNIDPGYTFIAKFSADGQNLLFSTDMPALSINGLQAAADGTLFIAGNATANFPYTMNFLGSPFPPLWAVQGDDYMFAAAISPAENQLTYAAYLGHGSVSATTLGSDGNFYMAGNSSLIPRLPLQNALETDVSSGGFVLSLTPSGQLASSTPFGGHFEQQVPGALAVDSSGNIFLASAPSPNGLSNDPLDPVSVGTGAAYSSQTSLGTSTSFIGFAASIAKISPSNQPQISLSYLGPYLVLRDAGSADLHISSITYSGGLQRSWGNCGSTVPGGSSCFLVPGTNSGYTASGTLTINSDAQPSQQTFTPAFPPISQLIAPFIYVEDVPLIFPPQVSGSASPEQTLQLTNVGASSTSVTVRANGPTTSLQVNSNCGSLSPGASCNAQIANAPSSGSTTGGALLIGSNSPISNDTPFVVAAGLNTTDPLQLSAPLLSFETVVVGQRSLPHPIVLTNATNSAITVPLPVIGNPDFSVNANSCTSALQPGQSCAIAIVYSPSTAGPAIQTTLTLAGNATQLILVGTPMAVPAVSPNPSSLTFGPLAASGTQSQTITLSNSGSAAVPVNGIVTSSPTFTQSNSCIGTLASLQQCSISVSFAPAGQVSAFSGTLWISLNGGAINLPVALTGTSTADVTASPSSLDFGSATVAGATSSSLSITLTNVSTSALSISPSFNGPFAASSNGCPSSLAASQTCLLGIDFTPTQAGTQQGTMTVAFHDGTPSLVVPLTGTAVAPPPIVVISPQSGASTSATVTSGQTASYMLVVTASVIFSGPLTFTCTGTPVNSLCSTSPSSVTMKAGGQANITVEVVTGESATAQQASGTAILSGLGLAAVLPGMILAFCRRRFSRRIGLLSVLAWSAIAVSGIVGCGGGSSAGGGVSSSTPPGTYTVALTATSGSQSVQQFLTLVVQ